MTFNTFFRSWRFETKKTPRPLGNESTPYQLWHLHSNGRRMAHGHMVANAKENKSWVSAHGLNEHCTFNHISGTIEHARRIFNSKSAPTYLLSSMNLASVEDSLYWLLILLALLWSCKMIVGVALFTVSDFVSVGVFAHKSEVNIRYSVCSCPMSQHAPLVFLHLGKSLRHFRIKPFPLLVCHKSPS